MAPDSRCACEKNEFSESRGLHLPIHRRTLNSLARYLVFLTNNSLWCWDCPPARFVANLYIAWLPFLPVGAVFSGLLRCQPLGSESLICPPNKTTLLFTGCDQYFLVLSIFYRLIHIIFFLLLILDILLSSFIFKVEWLTQFLAFLFCKMNV